MVVMVRSVLLSALGSSDQLVDHLTEDSGGPGQNPSQVHHVYSHPVTVKISSWVPGHKVT